MQIKLVNVGLVREATVDLRDLTIIMGPNNSGKSTIATIAYAAIKARSGFDTDNLRRPIRITRTARQRLPRLERSREVDFESVATTISQEPDSDNAHRTITNTNNLIAKDILEAYGISFVAEIERGFGAPITSLCKYQNGRRLPLRIRISSARPAWSVDIRLRKDSPRVEVTLNDELGFYSSEFSNYLKRVLSRDTMRERAFLVSLWADELSPHLFNDLPRRSHYLPAARAGLLQSHRLAAAAMFQSTPLIGINEVSMPALSGVVADFISEILLNETRRRKNLKLESAARAIENSVLRGKVRQLKSGSGYPEIEFEDDAGRFPVHRTSSMVSELSPIVLLLRHVVEIGELLIIEEPESHLHPETQTQLARILFEVSKFVPLLVTTHSDFFLSQINNEIRRQELAPNQNDEIDIAAFWVSRTQDGSSLQQLEVDSIDGIPEDSFAEVAMRLYDQQVEQQVKLSDGRR